MTKFGKLITAFLIVLALGIGAVLLMKKGGSSQKTALPDFNFNNSYNAASANPDVSVYPQNYENTDYGFTFSYPDGFDVKEIDEDQGFTVLAEGKGNKTFQIYINSFDEPGPITPERIKKDLPDMEIRQSQNFSLDGTDALAFQTDTTVEAWFVYGGNLYQATALKDFTDDLSKILATWKFK
ncbi:MAG: hypothetical protein Q7S12_04785 [bacterium]|nr:hypothetical protein [bacterium]